jgi:hypothetical protein
MQRRRFPVPVCCPMPCPEPAPRPQSFIRSIACRWRVKKSMRLLTISHRIIEYREFFCSIDAAGAITARPSAPDGRRDRASAPHTYTDGMSCRIPHTFFHPPEKSMEFARAASRCVCKSSEIKKPHQPHAMACQFHEANFTKYSQWQYVAIRPDFGQLLLISESSTCGFLPGALMHKIAAFR